ncbi:hypothetical protein ACXR0O_24530 [Verrucomicrobiota bacterium sgz303538]
MGRITGLPDAGIIYTQWLIRLFVGSSHVGQNTVPDARNGSKYGSSRIQAGGDGAFCGWGASLDLTENLKHLE